MRMNPALVMVIHVCCRASVSYPYALYSWAYVVKVCQAKQNSTLLLQLFVCEKLIGNFNSGCSLVVLICI